MAKRKHRQKNSNLMAQNRKARHDYSILQTVEAGLSLKGTEIKSIRAHRINLKDGFAQIHNGEAYLENVHISPYQQADYTNTEDPRRDRKLLLHRQEIKRLARAVQKKGITLIPLKVYIKHGFAKVLIGVAQGKHEYDKRAAIKKRDADREIRRYEKHY